MVNHILHLITFTLFQNAFPILIRFGATMHSDTMK